MWTGILALAAWYHFFPSKRALAAEASERAEEAAAERAEEQERSERERAEEERRARARGEPAHGASSSIALGPTRAPEELTEPLARRSANGPAHARQLEQVKCRVGVPDGFFGHGAVVSRLVCRIYRIFS